MKWPWRRAPRTLNELTPPAEVSGDPAAKEYARAWISGGRLDVSVRPSAIGDPAHWGIALVDTARLLGDAIEEGSAGVATVATKRIREGYDAHWTTVSGEPDPSRVSVHASGVGPLKPPKNAGTDADAVELVRIWSAGGQSVFVLRPTAFPDARIWGMFLCDLARSFALAHTLDGTGAFGATVARIRSMFDAEWSRPTDAPRGGFRD